MGQPVVHFDINSADGEGARAFYGELLGWKIQAMTGEYAAADYGLVGNAPEGIGGGIGDSQGAPPYVTVYVEVPDLDAALKKVTSLGGKQLGEIVDMPGVVTFGMFTDPQGNAVGLVKGDGTQSVEPTEQIAIGWFEILGTDGNALRDFYSKAFGWKFKVAQEMDYGEADTQSKGRGIPGGVGKSQGEPVVTVYAAVDDVTKYIERAESLGATKVMGPMDVGGGTEVAAIRDPQGNLFGLYKHVHPH